MLPLKNRAAQAASVIVVALGAIPLTLGLAHLSGYASIHLARGASSAGLAAIELAAVIIGGILIVVGVRLARWGSVETLDRTQWGEPSAARLE